MRPTQDVYGSADTQYLSAQSTDRKKRDAGKRVKLCLFNVNSIIIAVGVYTNSGLSGYQVAEGSLPNNHTTVFGTEGPNFPVQWNPRYTIAVCIHF